jgi:predicted amidohydrolase YtcJ
MRTIFRSANLIDGDSAARARHSVVVEGNSIAEVGPDPAIHPRPTDTVYDLAGKSLMPGMTQGHCQSRVVWKSIPATWPSWH